MIQQDETFEVRDHRDKGWYFTDDKFLNGYAKFVGIYAVGVYGSICRHANKNQKSWPSIQKICKELDIGKNSVIEAIKRLEFWNIVNKVRIGKQCTNRYILTKKTGWKKISEVYLKEYSEVCHINFKGLSDKLHEFATQTSIVRKHNSKETQKKGIVASSNGEDYSFNNHLSLLLKDKQKHIRIIAVYWQLKGFKMPTKKATDRALKRDLRAASNLTGYSIERIKEVIVFLRDNYDFKYTLESVFKFIDEDLTKLTPDNTIIQSFETEDYKRSKLNA